ncbi:hypothetical protein HSB1_41230 [Halogranum salarium B-1]|uniref:Uncharacterized protein n=1 Tax=Halogranum salarium B-1 TaxID=1210908 RepID=J2Z9W2_9EURY|nr:hypothetical protein HSB1_41230 [Halogranum salarium B-1]
MRRLGALGRDSHGPGVRPRLHSLDGRCTVDARLPVPGPTKSASPDDVSWWHAARIPWSALRSLTDLSRRPDFETV